MNVWLNRGYFPPRSDRTVSEEGKFLTMSKSNIYLKTINEGKGVFF